MKLIQFSGCHVEIFPEQQHLATVFPDGTRVEACPNHDEESKARAQYLGYQEGPRGLWSMTVDHELGHTICAEARGLAYSPALWHVAHPGDAWTDSKPWHEEEAEVLQFQKMAQALRLARLKGGLLP